MRKVLLAIAASILAAGSASAADLAARPYTKAPPIVQVYDWTGFYIGGDIGGVSQRDSGDSNFFQPTATANNFLALSGSNSSFIGGGHIGYNWQFAPTWVLGIEADAQWLNAKNSFCRGLDDNLTGCVDTGRGFATIESETKWLATVRGRLGWTFDRFMVYGTGGVAFGEVRTNVGFNCLVAGCANSGTEIATSGSASNTHTGWVAGGGIEWAFASNWLVRAEYLHVDLGNVNGTVFLPPAACSGGTVCGQSYSRDLTYDMGRVGLSYKFGGPVIAKY
ncbi:MAG: outer membrane protein [Afipia sp.]